MDDEGDEIIVTLEAEFQEALFLFGGNDKTIRFRIQDATDIQDTIYGEVCSFFLLLRRAKQASESAREEETEAYEARQRGSQAHVGYA